MSIRTIIDSARMTKKAALTSKAVDAYKGLIGSLMRRPSKLDVPLNLFERVTGNIGSDMGQALSKHLGSDFIYHKPSLWRRLTKGTGVAEMSPSTNRMNAVRDAFKQESNGSSMVRRQILPLMQQGTTPVQPDRIAERAILKKYVPDATLFGKSMSQQGVPKEQISKILHDSIGLNRSFRNAAALDARWGRAFAKGAGPGAYADWYAKHRGEVEGVRKGIPGLVAATGLNSI